MCVVGETEPIEIWLITHGRMGDCPTSTERASEPLRVKLKLRVTLGPWKLKLSGETEKSNWSTLHCGEEDGDGDTAGDRIGVRAGARLPSGAGDREGVSVPEGVGDTVELGMAESVGD